MHHSTTISQSPSPDQSHANQLASRSITSTDKLHITIEWRQGRGGIPIGVEQRGGAEVLLGVPPVGRAGGGAAGAEDALVHAVELGAVGLGLGDLLPGLRRRVLALEPRLDALVLAVEVGHVDDEVLDDEHVGQRRDRGCRGGGGDLGEAGEAVVAVDVHGAAAADPLAAAAAEGE
uniref:Uncharacterized protein n=1 Tax=Oryza brachyantha TaxID=4533 RepID=J3MPY0_ORYBR